MFTYLYDIYDKINDFLLPHMNWYVLTILYVFFMWGIIHLVKIPMKRESLKRKAILKQMYDVRDGLLKKRGVEPERVGMPMVDFLTFYMTSKDEEESNTMREKSLVFVKDQKGKPYLFILIFLLQVIIFMQFSYYMSTLNKIEVISSLPILATILTFFTFIARKKVRFIITILLTILTFVVYTKLPGQLLLFFFSYTLIKFVELRGQWLYYVIKNKKKTN